MQSNTLSGKVCLVTGAANGLGAAAAQGLADAGARVFLCDRDIQGLQATQLAIASRHGADRVGFHAVDVCVQEQVQAAVQAAIACFGQVDILLNNAGTGPQIVRPNYLSSPLKSWEVPVDKWQRIIEINAIAPFAFAQALIPPMLERGWGRIINISTTWETMLRPGFASYGPSKAAVESMSAGMARELQGTGVTVNVLHPGGPVDTAQVPNDIGVPRHLLLRPQVMVAPLVWLSGPQADDITGQRITAALWDEEGLPAHNLEQAGEPVAWPQLVKPLVMQQRGIL